MPSPVIVMATAAAGLCWLTSLAWTVTECEWNTTIGTIVADDRGRRDATTVGRQLIDRAMRFCCPGVVTAWRFRAVSFGTVRFQVWRPPDDVSSSSYRLLGENRIRVRRLGALEIDVIDGEQIRFDAGDVVGWVQEDFDLLVYEEDGENKNALISFDGEPSNGSTTFHNRRYSVGCRIGGILTSFNGLQWIRMGVELMKEKGERIEMKFMGGWGRDGILIYGQEGLLHFSVVLTSDGVVITYNFGKGYERTSVGGRIQTEKYSQWNSLTIIRTVEGNLTVRLNDFVKESQLMTSHDGELNISSITFGGSSFEEGRFVGCMKEVAWNGYKINENVYSSSVSGDEPVGFSYQGSGIATISFVDSRASIEIPRGHNDISLEFEYRTYERNGLLMHQNLPGLNGSYIAVYIHRERLHVDVKLDGECRSNESCFAFEETASDGAWHLVSLETTHSGTIKVSLDREPSRFFALPHSVTPVGALTLGGSDEKGHSVKGFLGCLRNVKVNSELLDIISLTTSSPGVLVGCSNEGNVCSSGGCSDPFGVWSPWLPWTFVSPSAQIRTRTCARAGSSSDSPHCLGDMIQTHVSPVDRQPIKSRLLCVDTRKEHPTKHVASLILPPRNFQNSIRVSFSTVFNDVFVFALFNVDATSYLVLSVNSEGRIQIQIRLNSDGGFVGFHGNRVADGNVHDVAITLSGTHVSFRADDDEIKSIELGDPLDNVTTIQWLWPPVNLFTAATAADLSSFVGCVARLCVNGVDLVKGEGDGDEGGTTFDDNWNPDDVTDTSLFDGFLLFLIGVAGLAAIVVIVKLIHVFHATRRRGRYKTEEEERDEERGKERGKTVYYFTTAAAVASSSWRHSEGRRILPPPSYAETMAFRASSFRPKMKDSYV